MFVLRHFYPLLDSDKDLWIVDSSNGEIVYDGMMGSIPDEFDDCEVTDFGIHCTGPLFFDVEVTEN